MNLQVIYISIVFLSFIVSIIYYRNHPKYFFLLSALLLITFIVEATGYYMLRNKIKHAFIFHFYAPIEFSILSYLFYREIQTSWIRKMILLVMPLFLIFSTVNIFYLQKLKVYNSYGFIIKGVLVVCWILLFFYDLYNNDKFENPLRLPMFWISIGLLFFFSGTIFLNGYIEHLMKTNMDLARKVFRINLSLNIFLYLCISYGLTWKKIKQT